MNHHLWPLLNRCLGKKSPGRELWVASLGCLLGSTLLLLALQAWIDSRGLLHPEDAGTCYVTLNKKVSGGILLNLSQEDKIFTENEILEVSQLPGVMELGEFSRNHFPLTVHVWPAGKIGLGAAARADLFFESVPDGFLDHTPPMWTWDENASFVPIIVPKFYLDLWNFGLAPSRSEYPSLSPEAASAMPIEIFIGEDQSVRLIGRFVAFSKRINSVLVPGNFLQWANAKFSTSGEDKYYFLWEKGEIKGPPHSLTELRKKPLNQVQTSEFSPLNDPAQRFSLEELLENGAESSGPSRLIAKLKDSPTEAFWDGLNKLGCETSREFPQGEWLRKAAFFVVWILAGFGVLVSLLTMATFAGSFRLLVIQSAEPVQNLIHLGFGTQEITRVFHRRFTQQFLLILGLSLLLCTGITGMLAPLANGYGMKLSPFLAWETLLGSVLYAAVFLWINQRVIRKSIRSFA